MFSLAVEFSKALKVWGYRETGGSDDTVTARGSRSHHRWAPNVIVGVPGRMAQQRPEPPQDAGMLLTQWENRG